MSCKHKEEVYTWEEIQDMWFSGDFTNGIPPHEDREIEIEDIEILDCDKHYRLL